MLPVVLPLPAADAWDTAPGANLILQTSAGRSFEFVGPLGTHSNVAGIHPKKNLTWLKPFGPSHLRARRRGGLMRSPNLRTYLQDTSNG